MCYLVLGRCWFNRKIFAQNRNAGTAWECLARLGSNGGVSCCFPANWKKCCKSFEYIMICQVSNSWNLCNFKYLYKKIFLSRGLPEPFHYSGPVFLHIFNFDINHFYFDFPPAANSLIGSTNAPGISHSFTGRGWSCRNYSSVVTYSDPACRIGFHIVLPL